MHAFRAKGFVCQNCKKLISYSPDQEGETLACPRCGERMTAPSGDSETSPDSPDGEISLSPTLARPTQKIQRRRPHRLAVLFVGLIVCAVVVATALRTVSNTTHPLLSSEVFRQLLSLLMTPDPAPTIAQTPVTVKGTDISINVTQMSRTCPMIYQSAIGKASPAVSPVYCVTVIIDNSGKKPVPYRTWRRITSEADIRQAATLQDEAGLVIGSLSFGPETWPAGTQQQAVIQPGTSFTDTLLFDGERTAHGECLLTLPCENLGKSGKLRFRIPAAMVR